MAKRALGIPLIAKAAINAGAARGRSLVLVYHRVTPDGEQTAGIIPSVPRDVLRDQFEVLLELGDVVPLEALLHEPRTRRRPRFSITFDDDYISHHDVALPLLHELGLTATFFLCGRSLHGLGPAWFEVLDGLVRDLGIERTCHLIRAEARTIEELALACETSDVLRRAVMDQETVVGTVNDRLGESQIEDLSKTDMTIGFHTLRHVALTAMDDRSLALELTNGRDTLAAAASQAIDLFAYPHGKADGRTARAVRDAGYRVAATGRPGPTTPSSDRFLLRRWEPGSLPTERFLASIAAKLNVRAS